MQHFYRRIYADPDFHALERKRSRFSWLLASIVMLTYFSFILVIAFAPELFATPIIEGKIITWGIPVGLFVILLSFLLTGVYVYRANKEFDQITKDIVDRVRKLDDA
ncbi:MAG: DUF485 domain-containing protein [Proteobacteria bacterium]|nr:DUF485 domain-containing protein [Pseudomonadota bacterium]MCH8976480.1 DUF485 domain-containing protein [Pseudomonadota bacterium]